MCRKTKGKKSEDDSYITLQLNQTAGFPVTRTALFSSSSSHHYLHPRGGLGGGDKRFLLQVARITEAASAFVISGWEYPIRGPAAWQRDSCPRQGSPTRQLPARSCRGASPPRSPSPSPDSCTRGQTDCLRAPCLLLRAAAALRKPQASLGCCSHRLLAHLCSRTEVRKVWRFEYQRHLT